MESSQESTSLSTISLKRLRVFSNPLDLFHPLNNGQNNGVNNRKVFFFNLHLQVEHWNTLPTNKRIPSPNPDLPKPQPPPTHVRPSPQFSRFVRFEAPDGNLLRIIDTSLSNLLLQLSPSAINWKG